MSLSTVDRFFSSKLKIERAQEHTRTLNNKIIDYIKSKPFKVVIEQDDNSPSHLWTLRVRNEIPYQLSAIIGDIIHNLRTSLDLLASDLVSLANENTKNVYFPFSNDAEGFEEMIKKRHLNRAGDEVVSLIRSFKAYKGGNSLLRAIHDLDITDKHKSLIPVAHYAGIKNFQMNNASGAMLSINNLHCGPIRDGMIIMSLPPANNVRIGQSFQPSLKLTLDNDIYQTTENIDLIGLLTSFTTLVIGIVNTFDQHFESKE
jgi:hypothetical protein